MLLTLLSLSSKAKAGVLEKDLEQIFAVAGIKANIEIQFRRAKINQVQMLCPSRGRFLFRVNSTAMEKSPTLYWGIHKLGFLFPHPKWQISPRPVDIVKKCGKGWGFKPAFKKRGFHLHTKYPSEWVDGFFMGKTHIAISTIKWHARNFQNLLQIQLLRGAEDELKKILYNKEIVQLFRAFQIQLGLGMSFSSIHQKGYYLIKPWFSLFRKASLMQLFRSLNQLNLMFPMAKFWTVELGTSEFTSTPFESTLAWINEADRVAKHYGKQLYVKVHTSTGQKDEKYGNFNFLPQYANKSVGILPHTTMFYGLNELQFPMYGRSDIADMTDFLKNESVQRPTLYFPQTSFWTGLDIDIPLFLTSYLTARSRDMAFVKETQAEGLITYTTGQELGYWLFDWTSALNSTENYINDPKVGLRFLGEDLDVWQEIIEFQDLYFKLNQLIQQLSSSNLLDELPFTNPLHDRVLLKDLKDNPQQLASEIKNLEEAVYELPDLSRVKNEELRTLLRITWLRIQHALAIRKQIKQPIKTEVTGNTINELVYQRNRPDEVDLQVQLTDAIGIRQQAQALMDAYKSKFNRYPGSFVFKKFPNPTSYEYGYGWTAGTLHYWEREEEIIRNDVSNPFFMNIYNIWDMLF